ncbi:polyhydroxyalkanoate synthesis repressor PhaR [Candidatus Methylocalor cossyra]|uniref:PhbF n=1 Tax=Candidatus Methylocalor cossyra TaxID=3108543 RepID=A0ABM9NHJ6_9GAMM
MANERIIKKYPNRRLYDPAISAYVTLKDIRRLVREGVKFRVVDAKTDEDITRSILLQVILEQEEQGRPIFTQEVLEQIIRTYGDAMQDFMMSYLQQTMAVFLQQQQLLQEQMTRLLETGPLSVFGDLARQNLKLWQSMQEAFLQRQDPTGPRDGQRAKPKPE